MKILMYALCLMSLYLALNAVSLLQHAKDVTELAMCFIAIAEALCLIVIAKAIDRHLIKIMSLYEDDKC
jgi:hypothetical protein